MSETVTKNFAVADAALMRSAIQRVATGPELSKNISRGEARAVMHAILDGSADPVQAGVFLIGLRMKRETNEEIIGVLDALRDRTLTVIADAPEVVVMADPYNGFNRTLQGSLFVLPVLAACGVNAYSHGARLVGPKFGVTHHTTLKALGGKPLRSVAEVSARLSDPNIGWGYLDQYMFAPELHALNDLRSRIVKRPVLSTTEVVLQPVRGASNTHLVTGYVHKPYRQTYAMLAQHIGFSSLLLVRGTEGGIIPSFRGKAHVVRTSGHAEEIELDIDLTEIDLARKYRAGDIPDSTALADEHSGQTGMKWDIEALAALCADAGRRALAGEAGPIQDAAVLGAALTLWHVGKAENLKEAARVAREAIASGAALERLETGL